MSSATQFYLVAAIAGVAFGRFALADMLPSLIELVSGL